MHVSGCFSQAAHFRFSSTHPPTFFFCFLPSFLPFSLPPVISSFIPSFIPDHFFIWFFHFRILNVIILSTAFFLWPWTITMTNHSTSAPVLLLQIHSFNSPVGPTNLNDWPQPKMQNSFPFFFHDHLSSPTLFNLISLRIKPDQTLFCFVFGRKIEIECNKQNEIRNEIRATELKMEADQDRAYRSNDLELQIHAIVCVAFAILRIFCFCFGFSPLTAFVRILVSKASVGTRASACKSNVLFCCATKEKSSKIELNVSKLADLISLVGMFAIWTAKISIEPFSSVA